MPVDRLAVPLLVIIPSSTTCANKHLARSFQVNKQGQTRLAKYTDQGMAVEERRVLEGEIVRKCLARSEKQACLLRCVRCGLTVPLPFERRCTHSTCCGGQCSFIEHRNYKVIYRRYASLFFLVGVDSEEVRGCLCLFGVRQPGPRGC